MKTTAELKKRAEQFLDSFPHSQALLPWLIATMVREEGSVNGAPKISAALHVLFISTAEKYSLLKAGEVMAVNPVIIILHGSGFDYAAIARRPRAPLTMTGLID